MKVYLGADPWGKELKDSIKDHLIHLTNSSNDEVFKNLEIQDLGTNDKYYEIAGEVAKLIIEKTEEKEAGKEEKRGILFCSTGMGMSIIANKYPGVYASPCESSKTAFNSRGINNSNVITLGSSLVTKEEAKEIVETWLKTKFTAGWEDNKETREFLIQSMIDIPELLTQPARIPYSNTPLYADSSKDEHFVPIPGMDERCKWCVLRSERDQNHDNMERVRMILRLPKGSMEPKHHHSHGHDIFVIRGHQTVENLTTGVNYTLRPGQYLYTPAGQVHQVYYHEDTEFWFGSDEGFDMIWDGEEKGVIYK